MGYNHSFHIPRLFIVIIIGAIGLIFISFTKVPSSPIPELHTLSIIVPPLLKPGDRVAIVAPAWWDTNEKTIIRETKRILGDWGLEVIVGNSVGSKDGQFAGNDSVRLADLQSALDDPTIKAIVAYRGGYGTTRLIDSLDFSHFLRYPKWVVGYSDITTIHLKLHQLGVVAIHGEMPKHFPDSSYQSSLDSLRLALFKGELCLVADPQIKNRLGQAMAPVVGGNLTMICSNIGTATDLDTYGKILVLEEVGEQPYAIDRMMVQLKRSGKLQYLAGLVVGNMVGMEHNPQVPFGKLIQDLIMEHVGNYTYPVAFSFPIGHTAPNMAFLHGAMGKLVVTEKSVQLSFDRQN